MSTSKNVNKICIAVIILALVLTILFMNGSKLGITNASTTMGYENRLFNTEKVHKIDIVMDDWDSFIETCEDEEYAMCTAVIDGEKYGQIAIRAKGNTSLSNVRQMGSQRYSFKIEFDHYDKNKSYYGLDKLCLNNLIQDNTMMKDYLSYVLMAEFGVDTPLCSFVYITVNGEDWGLYLAVEGVEDSFLMRNYGKNSGELYKPDSMSMGGGRGNGKDFDMDSLDLNGEDSDGESSGEENGQSSGESSGESSGNRTEAPTETTAEDPAETTADASSETTAEAPSETAAEAPAEAPADAPVETTAEANEESVSETTAEKDDDGFGASDSSGQSSGASSGDRERPEGDFEFDGEMPDMSNIGGMFGNMFGSDDVKLKYIDDSASSYSNIFDNAKTDISEKDKERLISSLKSLTEYTDLEEVVDIDEVLRYFVVHNFVVNGDSYTGTIIHNYYLHESNGQLSMIPWDYNLGFGSFMGGNATTSVNESIDNPISNGSVDDRPMIGWIFSSEEYTEQYHELFSTFIEEWIDSGKLVNFIEETAEMIKPYVEKDPTRFCTYEEFETGVSTIKEFVKLRGEAVKRQLSGDTTQVDASSINTSDMGSMGGNSMGGGNDMPDFGGQMPSDMSGFTGDMSNFDGEKTSGDSAASEQPTEEAAVKDGTAGFEPSNGEQKGDSQGETTSSDGSV